MENWSYHKLDMGEHIEPNVNKMIYHFNLQHIFTGDHAYFFERQAHFVVPILSNTIFVETTFEQHFIDTFRYTFY